MEDRAAVVYDVEFLRAYVSGRSVALAHRVACDAVAQRSVACASVPLAIQWPGMAGAAFVLPGLVNGYGKIEQTLRQQAEVLGAIEGRLEMVEPKLDRLCR